MEELRLHPEAYWAAKDRWPQVTRDTTIIVTEKDFLIVAIPPKDDRSMLERWTEPEPNDWPHYDQEEITLYQWRSVSPIPIIAMGYGPRSDTLAIRLMEHD